MIGERLTQLLEQYHWSQSILAEKVGVQQSYISQLCKGVRRPSVRLLRKISDAFGIKTDDLLADASDALEESSISTELSVEENAMIVKFRKLSARDRGIVHSMIDAMDAPEKGQSSLTSRTGEKRTESERLA